MKVVLVLFAFAVYANARVLQGNVDEEWSNFKLAHGKQYRSLLEEETRKSIFIENFKEIAEHNKLYNEGLVSYSRKINQYSDLTSEEMKIMLNGLKVKSVTVNLKDITVVDFAPDESVELPDEVDWRDEDAVAPVKNQGACGSCWAFSAIGALESQYFLKTGKLVQLSEQNLVDCSTEYNNTGCAGGDLIPAYEYIFVNDGIDSESSYRYIADDGTCHYKESGNVTSLKGYGYIDRGNEDHLKAAVATIGPIAVGIDASFSSFQTYASGIYYEEECSSGMNDPQQELDHGVLVIGYGTEDGQDYWLVKNSWGAIWGENGFIKMARNRSNNCGIASLAIYPIMY